MSSKTNILNRLAKHSFERPLPSIPVFEKPSADIVAAFVRALEGAAGRVIETSADDVEAEVRKLHPRADRIGSSTGLMRGTVDLRPDSGEQVVGAIELFVSFGELGVAENGAIWISDGRMQPRAALFATQHLIVVLRRSTIVWDMHDAYKQVTIDKEGFGLFVCGPSKTADIEQSLVIGAHGPRSLNVLLID